jgi:tRNA U34 5-carboxymethylaminomethyl modifying enzyme MnmG/GidA
MVLSREEIRQSEEYRFLIRNEDTCSLRMKIRTAIIGLSDTNHYEYLESQEKGFGDWWILKELENLVNGQSKIVGDFIPNYLKEENYD